MNNRSGIVMKTENNTIYLMTNDGEFIKVRLHKNDSLPMIGSEYCGKVIKPSFVKNNIFKYASVACLMLFTLLGGGGAYAYYKPVSTVTISSNPAIELKSNTWGKVVSATPINEDGKKVLQEVSLKNKDVEDALLLVLDQSKKDNFIDDNYVENETVQVSIKGKELNLSSFRKKISEDTLSVKIDNNGTVIYDQNSKNENNTSYDSKKATSNTSENPTDDESIDTNNNSATKDNLPKKNEDTEKLDSSNSPNKNGKQNNNNSTDTDYNSNSKSNNGKASKEQKGNNGNINSTKKNGKSTEKDNNKNSNNNGHFSDKKDK